MAAGVLGMGWFAAYLVQPLLGYEDTDDPALGLRFVRDHPHVFAVTGVVLIVFAVALTLAATSLAELHEKSEQAEQAELRQGRRAQWPVRATTAWGLTAAACLLVFGVLRIGASGPLLHIADLRQDWGETAYLVAQMAGVQGLLPAGVLALALWAVGWSLIGWRARTLPLVVCLLGIVPALHVAGRLLGELGLAPDAAWFVVVLTIPGTLLWLVTLGVVVAVAGRRVSNPNDRSPGRGLDRRGTNVHARPGPGEASAPPSEAWPALGRGGPLGRATFPKRSTA